MTYLDIVSPAHWLSGEESIKGSVGTLVALLFRRKFGPFSASIKGIVSYPYGVRKSIYKLIIIN